MRATQPEPAPAEEALRQRALAVLDRLQEHYGPLPFQPRREPMHELISTMLSHRTTGANEETAYRRLRERFPTWEAVAEAPLDELAETISTANFAHAKAPRIREAVRQILAERDEGSIDFLADLPAEEGLAWLTRLPGVGVKTATLVLLFCFHKPVMPVDTHVHRVSGRIGLIGPRVSAEAAHEQLLELLGPHPKRLYDFHHALLRHGRQICIWASPRCSQCPVTDLCDWFAENRAGDTAASGVVPDP